MRQIREVLRQKWGLGLSNRQIARSCGLGRPTVAEYLRRAKAAGFSWPLSAELDDEELERKLFPPRSTMPAERQAVPDWSVVNQEFKRKGVTLALLWDEYKEANPEGFQYSWFCDHYRRWLGKVDVVMRQDHRAGEKLFIDMPGRRCRSLIGQAVKWLMRRSSSRCVRPPPTLPMPRQPGRKPYRTGLAHMCVRSVTSDRCRKSWCLTILNRGCIWRIAMSQS